MSRITGCIKVSKNFPIEQLEIVWRSGCHEVPIDHNRTVVVGATGVLQVHYNRFIPGQMATLHTVRRD